MTDQPDKVSAKLMKNSLIKIVLALSLLFILLHHTSVFSQDKTTSATAAKQVLTLEDCLRISFQQNNDILKAREELKRTRGVVKEGYSGAWPSLTASGNYTRTDESTIEEIEGMKFGTDESYAASFSVEQAIYSGGRVSAGIRAAKLYDGLSRSALLTTTRNVEFDVKKKFFNALLARKLIDVQVETVGLFKDNLKNVQAKRDEGQVSDYEVLRATVALSNLQPDLIRSKNNFTLALDSVKEVLNLSLDVEIDLDGVFEKQPFKFEIEKLIETALANRSEITAQELTMKLYRENLVDAKSGTKPDISLFGNYAGRSETFGDADPSDLTWGWNAGVTLSWPLFDGFKTSGKKMQARAELSKSRIGLNQIRDKIELEVRRSFFIFNESVEVLESQEKSVDQAKESVRQSRILADLGQITQFVLRDAQLELRTARTSLEKALYDYNVAVVALQKAIGHDIQKLNTISEE